MVKQKSISTGSPSLPKRIAYSSSISAIGPIHAAATSKGLCRIILGELEEPDFVRLIEQAYGTRPFLKETPFPVLKEELERYLCGNRSSFSCPIEFLKGTHFDMKVWKALTRIPYGQTRSYEGIAHQIGHPGASRAVGSACGRNPLPIIIPCHRVIAKSGLLGGYTGGIRYKTWLLRLEKPRAAELLTDFV